MNNYKNGNMYQKSLIQQILEFNETLCRFKKSINDILESYTVKNNVFSFYNNELKEVTEGYFIVESTHDNLQDAIREVNNFSKCIRIIENKEFQVGIVTNNYSEIGNNKAVDLDTQTEIN